MAIASYSSVTYTLDSPPQLNSPLDRTYVTKANTFDEWRQFTNLLADDLTDLSTAVQTLDGIDTATVTFTNKTLTSPAITTPTITGNTTFSDGAFDFNIASHDGSNGLKLAGTLVSSSAAELNKLDGATVTTAEINIIDGNTSATGTTVAAADRVVYNDAGTMKQVAVTDLDTFFSGTTKTLTNKTLTSPVLNTPTITGDTTFSDGTHDLDIASHDGSNGLKLGGTLVTSSAAELNKLDGANVTTTEINIIDGGTSASSITPADADRVVYNDAGTMKQVALSTLDTHFSATTKTLTNKTLTSPTIGGTLTLNASALAGTAFTTEGDGIASEDLDTRIPTTAAVRDYVDAQFAAAGTIAGVNGGAGLTASGSSTITLAIGAGTGITVATDSISTNDSAIVHDNLSGFVANEHIDHTSVSINSGDGLTGGGTIASTRTLAVGAGTGIAVAANDVQLKNAGSLSNGKVSKWNNSSGQFEDSIITEGSGTITVGGNFTVTGTTSFSDLNITNVGSIALDTITNDGTDITLDSSGDIILDADGAQVRIKDGGTERFIFNTGAAAELDVIGTSVTIHSNTSDADMIFKGNDGGVSINALTLDMSAGGAATFNDKITAVGTSVFTNLDVSGQIEFGTGTVCRTWSSSDSDIDGLITGSQFGTIIEADVNGHFVLGIRDNDVGDSLSIISGGGNFGSDSTYDTLVAHFGADGLVGIGKESAGSTLDINGTLAVSGNVDFNGDLDVDGTLEADAITVNGTTLAETISDTVGAMVGSNTETGITVTYEDSDNTLDFVLATSQPTVTSLGTLTTLTVDNVIINGTTIGHTGDTDLITLSSGVVTVAGELDATSLDISGNADIDGTAHLDVVDIDGAVDMASTLKVDGTISHNISGDAGFFPGLMQNTFGFQSEVASTASNGNSLHLARKDNCPLNIGTAVGTSSTDKVITFNDTDQSNGTLGGQDVAKEVGSITITTSATAFNTSSDYRLKENLVGISDGITRVKQLSPKRFNFIVDSGTTVDGFIAHEVSSIVPEAITGTKDATDSNGNPSYQAIDQSKLVPLLTAALQEAITKIESLESRVAALES